MKDALNDIRRWVFCIFILELAQFLLIARYLMKDGL